ncbi:MULTISPECIES: YncE family protein [unclassified Streptomyces]|uniref:YncE family protein n=1 Tax=unclassified Streptomyces TaxID=2593676 RepID=UPI0016562091|nr:YncE family protein [Streptomyces sp. CB02980]MCB8901354.1 YncE family protein [Streptomyces sp. CB02980]
MTKYRRASRTARVLLPGAVAVVLLAGCAQGSGGAASATGPTSSAGVSPTGAPPTAGSSVTVTPAPAGRPAPGTLLVADFGSDTVTFVDPARGATGSVKVGTAPYGLVLGKDGRAWVATAEGVAVVDTTTRQRLALIPYETDTGPVTTGEYRGGGMGIALAPDGRRVYVGVNVPGGNGTLEVIDTTALRVTDTVPVGRRPFDVDVSRDGAEVYATNHDSFDVTVVDAGTWESRRVEVAPYGTEGGLGSWLKPHYTAVRPSDGKLLLPFEGERLAVVDPRTGRTTIEPMTANTHQHGAAVTADGTLLTVGTGPIDPDEDEGPSLTVRTPGGAERVYPLEGPHEDVAVSEDGRTAYVTGGFTRDGYWDGLSVVDLETGDVRRLEAGSRPLGVVVL